nr:hypothetical protein [Candidatus Omnitrophota bacterium]
EKFYYILTDAHVTNISKEDRPHQKEIIVQLSNGEKVEAKLIAETHEWEPDLSLIRIDKKEEMKGFLKVISLAQEFSLAELSVYGGNPLMMGFDRVGNNFEYKAESADVRKIGHDEIILMNEETGPGYSGGLVAYKDNLVGVVRGTMPIFDQGKRQKNAVITPVSVIKDFLKSILDVEGRSKSYMNIFTDEDDLTAIKNIILANKDEVIHSADSIVPQSTREHRNKDIEAILANEYLKKVLGFNILQGEKILVDVGIGDPPVTTIEFNQALKNVNPEIKVIGVELPQAVAKAHIIVTDNNVINEIKEEYRRIIKEGSFFNIDGIFEIKFVVSPVGIEEYGFISEIIVGYREIGEERKRYLPIGVAPNVKFFIFGKEINEKDPYRRNSLFFDNVIKNIVGMESLKNVLKEAENAKEGEFEANGLKGVLNPLEKELKAHGIDLLATDALSRNRRDIDFIVANSVTIHMSYEQKMMFLKEMESSLRNGGVLLIKNENAETDFNRIDVYYKENDKLHYKGTFIFNSKREEFVDVEKYKNREHLEKKLFSKEELFSPKYFSLPFDQAMRTDSEQTVLDFYSEDFFDGWFVKGRKKYQITRYDNQKDILNAIDQWFMDSKGEKLRFDENQWKSAARNYAETGLLWTIKDDAGKILGIFFGHKERSRAHWDGHKIYFGDFMEVLPSKRDFRLSRILSAALSEQALKDKEIVNLDDVWFLRDDPDIVVIHPATSDDYGIDAKEVFSNFYNPIILSDNDLKQDYEDWENFYYVGQNVSLAESLINYVKESMTKISDQAMTAEPKFDLFINSKISDFTASLQGINNPDEIHQAIDQFLLSVRGQVMELATNEKMRLRSEDIDYFVRAFVMKTYSQVNKTLIPKGYVAATKRFSLDGSFKEEDTMFFKIEEGQEYFVDNDFIQVYYAQDIKMPDSGNRVFGVAPIWADYIIIDTTTIELYVDLLLKDLKYVEGIIGRMIGKEFSFNKDKSSKVVQKFYEQIKKSLSEEEIKKILMEHIAWHEIKHFQDREGAKDSISDQELRNNNDLEKIAESYALSKSEDPRIGLFINFITAIITHKIDYSLEILAQLAGVKKITKSEDFDLILNWLEKGFTEENVMSLQAECLKVHQDIVREVMKSDQAMTVDFDKDSFMAESDQVGGIDLNAKNLTIENKGEKIEFNTPLNIKALENSQGLVPIIINITPVTNVYDLLGLANSTQAQNQKS